MIEMEKRPPPKKKPNKKNTKKNLMTRYLHHTLKLNHDYWLPTLQLHVHVSVI